MTKEEYKAYKKAWYQAHKEQCKASAKAWIEAHKEDLKTYQKAYRQAHKESQKAYQKAYRQAHKEQANAYIKAYMKNDLNAKDETKSNIRYKSQSILKKSGIKIPGYEIHHCFGYEDPSKFIYISKSLHLKIHQFLRDNNIDADSDHWMQIRDIVNDTDEFMYIKC